MKKRAGIFCLVSVLCFSLLLTSCAEAPVTKYVIPDTMESIKSGVVAQNGQYSLEWDDKSKCVLLRNTGSGFVWSTTPYDYFQKGGSNYNLCSPLIIDYYNSEDGSINTVNAAECIDLDLVSADKTEQGLKVSYYFDEAEITISVTYALRNDSLCVSLNTADIEESGISQLLNVSVTPYMSSVKNEESHSSYLFVPSGSGALMYTDTSTSDIPRSYSGEVYGNDPVRTQLIVSGYEEPVRLPVFGTKAGGNAICGIIENGEGAAVINASAGNSLNGYSTVYATFNVRGYNNAELGTGSTVMLSKEQPENTEFAVGYYPLEGEKADYNGMAECYREYLKNKGGLKQSEHKQSAYHITLVGGAEVNTHTLGIPHTSLLPLTTFSQAKDILTDIEKTVENKPEVLLKGFGKSGLDTGKLAGGFAFSGILNKEKGQQGLEAYCKQEEIALYTDFDLIHFSKSGSGFSATRNIALTANLQGALLYSIKRNVLTNDEESNKIKLLQRSELEKAADKLIDFSKNRISGVGLSSIGSTAYSDYQEEDYMLKGGLEEQMGDIVGKITSENHSVTLSAANAYIAGKATSITDVPLQNGGYDALDETVPFYEMVYRGYVPLYSTAVNLSPNAQKQLLRAVEAGVSPSFLLSNSYDAALAGSDVNLSSSIVYENNKELIDDTVKKTSDFLNIVAGAKIRSHTIIEDGVTKTVFDNGVAVTVNHTNEAVHIGKIDIPAMSFSFNR